MKLNRMTSRMMDHGRGARATMICLCLLAAGCNRNDMRDQPRFEPYEASDFFADGSSARPLVAGTIARSGPATQPATVIRASVGNANVFPFPITRAVLNRGRERYTIFCTPCHGDLGNGEGMIVQRGFTKPPTFHQLRLRNAPPGHFYDVISNGYGAMYSYNDRITPDDRWAIVAYIRVLQLSQNAPIEALNTSEVSQITSGGHGLEARVTATAPVEQERK
jgi:hypothetical protein